MRERRLLAVAAVDRPGERRSGWSGCCAAWRRAAGTSRWPRPRAPGFPERPRAGPSRCPWGAWRRVRARARCAPGPGPGAWRARRTSPTSTGRWRAPAPGGARRAHRAARPRPGGARAALLARRRRGARRLPRRRRAPRRSGGGGGLRAGGARPPARRRAVAAGRPDRRLRRSPGAAQGAARARARGARHPRGRSGARVVVVGDDPYDSDPAYAEAVRGAPRSSTTAGWRGPTG